MHLAIQGATAIVRLAIKAATTLAHHATLVATMIARSRGSSFQGQTPTLAIQ